MEMLLCKRSRNRAAFGQTLRQQLGMLARLVRTNH